MVEQAQEISKALIENADKRRKQAEQAEEAAMEEQQQLLREINKLLERAFAQAMREVKHENSVVVGDLELKLAVEKAKNATRATPKKDQQVTKGGENGADKTPNLTINNYMPKGGGSRKIKLTKGKDGSLTGEARDD